MKRLMGLVGLAVAGVAAGQNSIGVHAPKLVVVISIDQFRDDYVSRFYGDFLPARSGGKLGGFRFLTETGAWYKDAHHNHVPTATGPGHSTLLTGSEPCVDGIVSNDWFDRWQGKGVYCVDDPASVTVGGSSKPMSPLNLKVTTVGDELKLATNGQSKVVSLALKDRAAILMAGHAADEVVWFENGTGNWVTSSWYAPTRKLPGWAQQINSDRLVDHAFGTRWEPLLPASSYALTRQAPAEKPAANDKLFSHALSAGSKPDRAYWSAIWTSHWGNEFTEQSAERALAADQLGKHDVPDMLIIGFSANDTIGHRFGPNSPEVMDATIRTDRVLSRLFNAIDRQVGIDNVDIVVTADHGVLPIPEESTGVYHNPGGRQPNSVTKPIQDALTAAYGEGPWVLGEGLYEQNFYLNRETAASKKVSMRDVERLAAETAMKQPGVYMALTRTQLLAGEVPPMDWTKRAENGFNPLLGGDVMIFEAPGALFDAGTGTSHGTVWEYDTHVPILLRGAGINHGVFTRRVVTADIASTLCLLMGIEYPTGNMGHPLSEAIK